METIFNVCSYINKVCLNAESGIQMIYRGHSSCNYELKTSVGRLKNYSIDLEKRLFLEFKKLFRPYTSERPETDLELMFMAQHYGIPTRLLDWTFNPLIALYFASKENSGLDGKVYSIKLHKSFKVEELEETSLSINKLLKIKGCKYIIPHYTDTRYYNQKSIFLLSDKPKRRFLFADKEIVYIIKSEAKQQIRQELALLGINESFVLPTLDHLSDDIINHVHNKSY